MEGTQTTPAPCPLVGEPRPLRMAGFDEDEADYFTGVLPLREGDGVYRLLMFKAGRLIDTSRPLDTEGNLLGGEVLAKHEAATAQLLEPR